jgi:hypothetical protein
VSGDLTDSGGRAGTYCTTVAAAALLAGAAQPIAAATFFSPFAVLGYQNNSNVFTRPSSSPPFAAEGITALGDSILGYEAGLGTELDFGQDVFTVDANATRDQYDRFSFLNHYEYFFDGKLNWRLGPVVDGSVMLEQNRYMAPFTDTFTTGLLLDTERVASATVRILVMPEWRLDLTPEVHEFDTPLPGYPDFKLNETIGIAGIDYLGFGRLTSGLQFTDDEGRYRGITDATSYDQREADLTANYKVSGFSTFSGSAGYTVRDTEANPADSVGTPAAGGVYAGYAGALGKTSTVTGSLSYQRQLTGKTSMTLSIFRRVDSYTAGANPDVGTGGDVGVAWKADPKFTLNLTYALTEDKIRGGLVLLDAANRNDRLQTATFEVRYAALTWLTIRPYADYDKASSSFMLGNYSATIVGVDVTARFRW